MTATAYRFVAYADGIGHAVRTRARRLRRLCDNHSLSEQFAYPVRVKCPSCVAKIEEEVATSKAN